MKKSMLIIFLCVSFFFPFVGFPYMAFDLGESFTSSQWNALFFFEMCSLVSLVVYAKALSRENIRL